MYNRVIGQPSGDERSILFVYFFHKGSKGLALQACDLFACSFLNCLQHTVKARVNLFFRNLLHRRCRGSGPDRIDKGKRVVKTNLTDHVDGILHVLCCFSREADHDICRQRNIGDFAADFGCKLQILFFRITAVHRL